MGLSCGVVSGFLTRDRTQAPCTGRWIPSHWTTGEVPKASVLILSRMGPLQGVEQGGDMVYFNLSCIIGLLVEDRQEGEVEGMGRGQGGQLRGGIQAAVMVVWGQGRSSGGAGKGLDSGSVLEVL